MPSRKDYDIKYGTQNLKQHLYFKSQYTCSSVLFPALQACHIQGVPGGIVNILGGGGMDYSE